MGSIVCFANMKGGVGKTTCSVIFAETLAHSGKKVLYVDFDAQASGSYSIAGEDPLRRARNVNRNVSAFLAEIPLRGAAASIDDFKISKPSALTDCATLDLFCSTPELRPAERRYLMRILRDVGEENDIEHELMHARRPLVDALQEARKSYDNIVVDCPPGISTLVEAACLASDVIVCPTIPDPLSTLGLEYLISRFYRERWFAREAAAAGGFLPPLRLLFTMVERRNSVNVNYIDRVRRFVDTELRVDIDRLEVDIPRDPGIVMLHEDPDRVESYRRRYGAFRQLASDFTGSVLEACY